MNLRYDDCPLSSADNPKRQHVKEALVGIATTIRAGPDEKRGVRLRLFLWSLYNQHHLVNLWHIAGSFDSQHAAWISDIFTAAMANILQGSDLKEALVSAGEMERWENQTITIETIQRFNEAQQIIESLIRTLPPGFAHTELVRLHREFAAVAKVFHESREEAG